MKNLQVFRKIHPSNSNIIYHIRSCKCPSMPMSSFNEIFVTEFIIQEPLQTARTFIFVSLFA